MQAINHLSRLQYKYPSDDVRYVPTLDEEAQNLRNVSLDQVRLLYHDYTSRGH
jgi:hypothetical protein